MVISPWSIHKGIGMTIITMEDILNHEKPSFKIGNDGLPYAVFKDNGYTFEYNDLIDGFGVNHFGNYENSVLIQNTIGL